MPDDIELQAFMTSIDVAQAAHDANVRRQAEIDAMQGDFDDEDGAEFDDVDVRTPEEIAEAARVATIYTGLNAKIENVQDEILDDQIVGILSAEPLAASPNLEGIDDPELWRRLASLPNLERSGIRALGRKIFPVFPCFRDFNDGMKRLGHDGLVELRVVGFSSDQVTVERLRRVAEWIDKNGSVVNSTELSFNDIIPGYRPRVTFAISDEYSFLLVSELKTAGAPHDANYVYAWPGGRRVYAEDHVATKSLEDLGLTGIVDTFVRVEPAPYVLEDMGAAPEDMGVQPLTYTDHGDGLTALFEGAVKVPAPTPAPPVVAAEPAAPARPTAPLPRLRELGFAAEASDAGPILKAETSGGLTMHVSGSDKKSIALAKTFDVRMIDANGSVVETYLDVGVEEVIAHMSAAAPKL